MVAAIPAWHRLYDWYRILSGFGNRHQADRTFNGTILLIAALGTYIVFHFLAKMTTADPQEGSFCYYAGKAFGRWARFGCGWNYWSTKILIMGSQLTALSILSRFWFPNVPLWLLQRVMRYSPFCCPTGDTMV